jgi:hypothetical protein
MIDLLATLAVLLPLTWIASRYIRRHAAGERGLLWVSFVAHQIAAIGNIAVTAYYYGYGDMMSYYQFGVLAADRLRADFWAFAPDLVALIFHRPPPIPLPIEVLSTSSGSMQGIAGFAMYFLFDSLHAACAAIAGFAFLSKLALYRVAREELPDLPLRPLLFACMLLPSTLFWSSSLLKEPVAMIGLLAALYGWHQLINGRRRARAILLVALGSVVVIEIKGYVFPVLGLSAAFWHWARKMREERGDFTFKAGHVLIGGFVAVLLVAATGALLPQFAPDALTDQLAGLQSVGAVIEGGSSYSLGQKAGSPASQAALAPLGLLTALFRPLVIEAKTPIVLISALEMTGFLLGAVLVLVRRGVLASVSELVRRPFLSFCAMFVLVFGTCVGLGTTNMGTLSRYRIPLAPFFATLLLALIARAPRRTEIQRASRRIPVESNPKETHLA